MFWLVTRCDATTAPHRTADDSLIAYTLGGAAGMSDAIACEPSAAQRNRSRVEHRGRQQGWGKVKRGESTCRFELSSSSLIYATTLVQDEAQIKFWPRILNVRRRKLRLLCSMTRFAGNEYASQTVNIFFFEGAANFLSALLRNPVDRTYILVIRFLKRRSKDQRPDKCSVHTCRLSRYNPAFLFAVHDCFDKTTAV